MDDEKKPPVPAYPNLRPAKKGEIRNPWGAKGKSGKGGKNIRSVLVELLNGPAEGSEWPNDVPPMLPHVLEDYLGRKPTRMDVMSFMMLCRAQKGDVSAFNAVLDRVEGKPMQHIKAEAASTSYEDFLKTTQAQLEGDNHEEEIEETQIQQGQEAEPETGEEN